MKKILTKTEVLENKIEILEAMKKGKIFVYPTDTIYGIGTNAKLEASVKKIRDIKDRDSKPFSVIVKDKDFILENCEVNEKLEKALELLPGPYTFFLNLKNSQVVATEVNPSENNASLGVRLPRHWFTELVNEAGINFITTSVNKSGEKFMTSLEDLDPEILEAVDYVIYEGEIVGEPSQKLDFSKN